MSTYNLTCTATSGNQTYSAYEILSYLPEPSFGGCGSKIDRLTGATIVRNSTAGETAWKKIFPVGFFDETGSNSTVNPAFFPLDRLYQAHAYGMNMVSCADLHSQRWTSSCHISIPSTRSACISTLTCLTITATSHMSNNMSPSSEIRSNLIGWYTGDEPDGSDPATNATQLAYDKIYEIDGYHPVSVTLNCYDYKFIEYGVNGADQIGVDPYPVNLNGAFSRKYGTPNTPTFGVTGCDNCEGSICTMSP